MTADPNRIAEAFRTLGLPPGATLADAKKSFRDRVKTLHPDRSAPTEDSLAALSNAIAAMRLIESAGLFEAEVWISPEQGRTGVTRLVSGGLRREFVRIPAGTADGAVLSAIGDPSARITIRFREETVDWTANTPNADAIQRFIADFVAPSPATRFARWARTPSNAA